MKNLIAALVILLGCATGVFGATSYTAATCSQSNVQTAVTSCTNDAQCTQVNIPAGSCTWSSPISVSKQITISGQGASNTIISSSGQGVTLFNVSGAARITGIGLRMYGYSYGIYASGQGWRIDHCTFSRADSASIPGAYGVHAKGSSYSSRPAGLIDNCRFTDCRTGSGGVSNFNAQHQIWAADAGLGTPDAVYIEDCTLERSVQGNVIDSGYAGKFVLRFNTIYQNVDCHATQPDAQLSRGTRSWEIYNNTFPSTSRPYYKRPIFLRAGEGVLFNNTITGPWSVNVLHLDSRRTYDTRPDACDGNSPFDSNYDATGWICRDDPGAGKDKALTVSTGTYGNYETTWQDQNASPAYAWGNTYPISANLTSWEHLKSNRDYYDGGTWGVQTSSSSPFNGTSGVGRGTFANRPSTCTTGVGYWATDRGGNWNTINADSNDGCLYKCTGTNTWSSTCSYTPYTYPHPLSSGSYIPPEDTTPPVIQSTSPSGNVEYSATKTITASTNENAMCAICTPGGSCDSNATFNEVYAAAGNVFMTTTGGTTHSQTVNVAESTEYNYYISCRDVSANQNAMTGVSPYAPMLVNFTTGASGGGDTTAPVMSNPLPAGIVYPCGSDVTLSVNATDDSGTVSGCKYNTTDVAYASMSGTFDAPGGVPSSQVADSYDVSATLALEISGNAAHRTEAGKSFTATIAGTLDNIRFRLGKYGSPTGNVTVKVYAHTGTYGTSSVPTGDALATSDNVDAAGIRTSSAFVTFTFSGANRISLEEGTYYVATVAYGGGDASNYIRLYRESTALGHSGNDVRNDSGSWAAYTTREAPFYVTVISGGGTGAFSDTLTAPACGQSYTYYYRCTDGSNTNISSETATFTIAGGACPIAGCIEFEAGTNTSPMIEYTDAAASGGQYVATTTELQGTSTHSVVIGTAGTYRIIARVNAADTGADSIFLAIDGGDPVLLALNHDFSATNWNVWREEVLYNLTAGSAWEEYHVALTADTHSFVFTGREANAKLDYFYLELIPEPIQPHLGTTRFIITTGQTMVISPTTGGCTVIIE